MRLCLIGMSGVGKSFWAKRLAERGWARHDCDGAIGARLGSLVTEEVTREALDAASAGDHVIDATGSVIYLSDSLRARIRAECRVVYLRTPDERRDAMLARYLQEPKPVVWAGAFDARGQAPEDALPRCYAELLALRDRRYAALAHVTLDGAELEANDPGVDGFLARAGC